MMPFSKFMKETMDLILKRFRTLQTRVQNLILILGVVIIFSALVNVIYKPQQSALLKLKQEASSLNNRVKELKARIPDIEKERRELQSLQESVHALKEELGILETKLPAQGSLPQLLGELVRQSAGGNVDFTSIKPSVPKEENAYSRLNLEMQFEANYGGLMNYLYRLENLSQFISTESLVVSESSQGAMAPLNISMVLTTLLGDDHSRKQLLSAETVVPFVEVKKNPFMSLARPSSDDKKENEFRLSGILNRGPQSSAIINDAIYKIGDRLGEATVQDILPEGVVLKRNNEEIILHVNHETE